jgi:hypothetical protein
VAFALVVFSSYEVTEKAPYLGERRARIGEPTGGRWSVLAWRCWWEIKSKVEERRTLEEGSIR